MSELIQRFGGLRTVLSIGGVCAVGVTAWIYYYLTDDEDDDEFKKVHKTSRNVAIKVEVSKENIGMIIGRNGSNVKSIEKQTDTRISCDYNKDTESTVCVLTIRGTSESVGKAESIIHRQINEQPIIEVKEMFIPTLAVGRLIGKVGTTIKDITKRSNAKIMIDTQNNSHSEKTKITIKGSVEQISLAMSLINEKVEEFEEVNSKMNASLVKRSPYRNKRNDPNTIIPPVVDGEAERLISTSSDGSLTVFLSAVSNPDKFWVQIMNDRAVELDQLVESMTDYYNTKVNQDQHRLSELKPGQIVAALYDLDQKWYRAEVCEINEKEDQRSVQLYYVDYGDSVDTKVESVLQLKSTFLTLRFQAIQCCLANVAPVGEKWAEEAVTCFEDITYLSQWKPLLARVECYKERNANKRSGSPIPCISLYDTSGEQDVDISEELIKKGYAINTKNSPEKKQNGDSKKQNGGSNSSDSDTLIEDPKLKSKVSSTNEVSGSKKSAVSNSLPIPPSSTASSTTPKGSIRSNDLSIPSGRSPSSSVSSMASSNKSTTKKRDGTTGENSDKKKRKF